MAVVVGKPARRPTPPLITALKGRIANFKVPKHCFVVDALPRNTMGKVQKNLLRDAHKGCSLAEPLAPDCCPRCGGAFHCGANDPATLAPAPAPRSR